MFRGLRIPFHRVDAPGIFILPVDPAWDHERIAAELDECVALRLADERRKAVADAAAAAGVEPADLDPEARAVAERGVSLTAAEEEDARARHPWRRYVSGGASRFDLGAPDMGPRGSVSSVREYLRPDSAPAMIHLRRLTMVQRIEADLLGYGARVLYLVRRGVARITEGDAVLWQASGPDDLLPEEWVERLAYVVTVDAINRALPATTLGAVAEAVRLYSEPLTDAEKKH